MGYRWHATQHGTWHSKLGSNQTRKRQQHLQHLGGGRLHQAHSFDSLIRCSLLALSLSIHRCGCHRVRGRRLVVCYWLGVCWILNYLWPHVNLCCRVCRGLNSWICCCLDSPHSRDVSHNCMPWPVAISVVPPNKEDNKEEHSNQKPANIQERADSSWTKF